MGCVVPLIGQPRSACRAPSLHAMPRHHVCIENPQACRPGQSHADSLWGRPAPSPSRSTPHHTPHRFPSRGRSTPSGTGRGQLWRWRLLHRRPPAACCRTAVAPRTSTEASPVRTMQRRFQGAGTNAMNAYGV
eukprot:285154-Chlamydomonas_euryale.AAC.8